MKKTKTIRNLIVFVCLMTALIVFLCINQLNVSRAESVGKNDFQRDGDLTQSPSAAGILDTNFGTMGRMIVNVSPTGGTTQPHEWANAVAVQTDGKIVAAGYSGAGFSGGNPPFEQFALVRLNPNSSLDTSFGTSGIVTTQASAASGNSRAQAIAIQTDGKIIAAGFAQGTQTERDFALVRYNANGSIDTTFGTNGIVYTGFGTFSFTNAANAMILQPDGKIVVGGFASPNFGDEDFALARYNSNGSLDTTFGTGDKVTTNFGSTSDRCWSLALQTDGKIVAGGQFLAQLGNFDFALTRYNSNGTPDTTFGTNGKLTTDMTTIGDVAQSVAVQPDGKILASGGSPSFLLARYNTNGSLDTNFGGANTGKVVMQFAGGAVCNAMLLQPDGKIILGGTWGGALMMARFNRNGTTDGNFGNMNGISTAVFPPDGLIIYAMTLQSDGKIIVAGLNSDGTNLRNSFVFARYFNDTRHATADFDGDGKTDLSVFRSSEGNWYESLSSTNSNGVLHWGFDGDTPAPADFDGDGKTDPAVCRNGDWYILQSSTMSLRFENFGISIDKPVPADYDGDGRADVAIFRPFTGDWWILRSSDGQAISVHWGQSGDIPTPADFDGDGKTDISIWRPGTANSPSFWYTLQSSNNTLFFTQFGLGQDRPVPADYDGDGKANYAVFRPSNGTWYTSLDPATNYGAQVWGSSTDVCVPGDYDGDGKADVAIYRNGVWYIKQSANGIQYANFGLANDTPIPFAATPR